MISMTIASKAPHKAVPITIYQNQCGEHDEKNKSAYCAHQALHMEPLSDPVFPACPPLEDLSAWGGLILSKDQLIVKKFFLRALWVSVRDKQNPFRVTIQATLSGGRWLIPLFVSIIWWRNNGKSAWMSRKINIPIPCFSIDLEQPVLHTENT